MKRWQKWFLGLGVLFIVYRFAGQPDTPVPAPVAPENDPAFGQFVVNKVRETVQRGLKDPSSVTWGPTEAHVVEQAGKAVVIACGSYSAVGALGRVGAQRFYGNGGELGALEADAPARDFALAWQTLCSGRILVTVPGSES